MIYAQSNDFFYNLKCWDLSYFFKIKIYVKYLPGSSASGVISGCGASPSEHPAVDGHRFDCPEHILFRVDKFYEF